MERYFITWDLEKTLVGWVDFLDDEKYDINQNIRNRLMNIINTSFDNDVVDFINYNDICDYFSTLYKNKDFLLTLDDWIYIDNADYHFSSTRVYDNQKVILSNPSQYKVSQRDGLKISTQNYKLKDAIIKSWKKDIILCDDWLFSWDTLKSVINYVKELWVLVKEIRVILNFTNSDNLGWIPIISMYEPSNCIDWLDERDLFYWTKNWWASFFNWNTLNWLPYVSTNKIASKKASIPEEKSNFFCESIIDLNKQVWEELEKNKSKVIRLANLPRIWYLLDKYDRNLSIWEVLDLEKNKIIS